jgi:hypothetical protein
MNQKFSIKIALSGSVGFVVGFVVFRLAFDFPHESGVWFPILIGLWATLLLVGFALEGKSL